MTTRLRAPSAAPAADGSGKITREAMLAAALAKPVNDLSRGALVDDIIYTLALTATQSRAG